MYLSSDNIYQIIQEKDLIIEDLQRRLRTMSALNMPTQKVLFNEDHNHHRKSNSFPDKSTDEVSSSTFSSFLRLLGGGKRHNNTAKSVSNEKKDCVVGACQPLPPQPQPEFIIKGGG